MSGGASWWRPAGYALLAVSLMNVLVFVLGWSDRPDDPALLPGWVFFAVWSVLFVLMGTSYWALSRIKTPAASEGRKLIWWMIVACLTYPLYTAGLSSDLLGFIGNVAIGALGLWAFGRIVRFSWLAAAPIIPVLTWLVFATFLTARAMGWA